MIPKLLFQTHEHGVPPHVEHAIRERAPGWDYRHFAHEDIVAYFAALQEEDPDCRPLHDAICEAHEIAQPGTTRDSNNSSSNNSSSNNSNSSTTKTAGTVRPLAVARSVRILLSL